MKIFIRFLVLVGVLGILAVVIVGLSLNALVKRGVEAMGSRVAGVPVTLEDAEISLLSGGTSMRASLTRLVIDNPEGYTAAHAVSFPNIQVEVDRNSVLADTIIVEEVRVVGPTMTFEGSPRHSNLSDILDNIKRNTRSHSDNEAVGKAGTPGQEAKPEKSVHIKHVNVQDATIALHLFGSSGEAIHVPLPDFELRDIGNPSGGTSLSHVSAGIFEAMYAAILKAVTKSETFIPQGVRQLGKSVEGLGKAVEKAGKKLLKGLFRQ